MELAQFRGHPILMKEGVDVSPESAVSSKLELIIRWLLGLSYKRWKKQ
jgi:hypothetical protein